MTWRDAGIAGLRAEVSELRGMVLAIRRAINAGWIAEDLLIFIEDHFPETGPVALHEKKGEQPK